MTENVIIVIENNFNIIDLALDYLKTNEYENNKFILCGDNTEEMKTYISLSDNKLNILSTYDTYTTRTNMENDKILNSALFCKIIINKLYTENIPNIFVFVSKKKLKRTYIIMNKLLPKLNKKFAYFDEIVSESDKNEEHALLNNFLIKK
jgi:hypothetical protein